jgi:hypothetical protein
MIKHYYCGCELSNCTSLYDYRYVTTKTTSSMGPSPSSKAITLSAIQESPDMLRNAKLHYHAKKPANDLHSE